MKAKLVSNNKKIFNIRMRSALVFAARYFANLMLAVAGAVAVSVSKTVIVALFVMVFFAAMFTIGQIMVDNRK